MQFTMWLLLGGTVGLAAWVSSDRNHLRTVAPLTQEVSIGTLRLRLPADWTVTTPSGEDNALLARPRRESESDDRLSGVLYDVPDHRSVKEFLFGPDGPLQDQVPNLEGGPDYDPGLSGPGATAMLPMPVGGVAGLLIKLTGVQVIPLTGPAAVTRWIACGIFSGNGRKALLLELDVPHEAGDPTDSDTSVDQDENAQLLRNIAGTIHQTAAAPTGDAAPRI